MTQNRAGLAHALCEVPELLSSCLCSWLSRGEGIRQLRLVCRDIRISALQAVQSCTLQVGEGARPETQELLLLLKTACLEELTLTILVTSGYTAPFPEQQLATCMAHLLSVTEVMQAAVRCVRRLNVAVCHMPLPCSAEIPCGLDTDSVIRRALSVLARQSFPNIQEAMFHTVLTSLAASVPNLTELNLGSRCGSAALIEEFGSRCQQLISLEVDCTAMRAADLQHISKHIPHLTRFIIRGDRKVKELDVEYLQGAMSHLQHCAKLTALTVDFVNGGVLSCSTQCWNQFPATVEEFSCSADISYENMPAALCAKLKRLTTRYDGRDEGLARFLHRHPCLTALTLISDCNSKSIELIEADVNLGVDSEDDEFYTHQIPALGSVQRRFEAGLQLTCSKISLYGSSEAVRDTLAWLPPLSSVTTCSVGLNGTSHVPCLEHIARVFPNLTALDVMNGETEWEYRPNYTDAEYFRPLFACSASLETLSVLMNVSFTTEWLVDLCKGLPSLISLSYMRCEGVNDRALQATPQFQRDIEFQTYTRRDFHVSEHGGTTDQDDEEGEGDDVDDDGDEGGGVDDGGDEV